MKIIEMRWKSQITKSHIGIEHKFLYGQQVVCYSFHKLMPKKNMKTHACSMTSEQSSGALSFLLPDRGKTSPSIVVQHP